MDREKFIQHLKSSGIPFTDAEIEAEADAAVKDAKAEERRTILNAQKVEAPAVAQSSPAIAAAAPPPAAAPAAATPSVPTAPAGTTPADLFTGKTVPSGMGLPPEQRVGAVGQNVAAAGGNFVQDSLDYARNAIANNPELTGALAAIPLAYGANKLGLFDNLGSKMSASAAQPQPFSGGAGPRITPAPIQDFGIHDEPSFYPPAAAPAAAPAATPAAAPSRNLTLEEAQARMAGVTPTAAPTRNVTAGITPAPAPVEVAPAIAEAPKPVAPAPAAVMPARPVVPTPPAAATTAPAPVPPTGELKTGSGLTAYAGEGKPRERFPKEFKTIADVPKGYAFIPGAGPGTNTMRNLVGQEGYNEAVRLHGGPFGSHQEAVDFMDKYNAETRIGPPADRELRKKLKLPMPENTTGIPFKVPKAIVAGIGGAIVAMSDVAKAARGDTSGLKESAFNVALGAIPEVNVAAQALMGTNVGAPTVRSEPFADVLQRPGVKEVLQNMSQTMSPAEFNVARDQYLAKLSSFPEYNSLRFTKPMIGSTQAINRRTLLPVAPPAR